MSIASTLLRRSEAPARSRHPNELDLMRVERSIAQRARYRYVEPTVTPVVDGYLIRSACCSRKIDPEGGEIDVALLQWNETTGEWLLLRKDHDAGCWLEDSRFARLPELFNRLNADPQKLFWQ